MATVNLLPDSRNLPSQLTIRDQPAHSGGEGNIYFSTDNRYVVKIYHRLSPEKPRLLQHILELGKSLGNDEQYLAWPLGIINKMNGRASVGVVTRRVPSTYQTLVKLIYSPIDAVEQFRLGRSWLEYLKIARGTAAAVRAIHGKGMAHGDVHLKNFLANPISAEVVMIDLDGLIVKGFLPPQVKGMQGFIAPEVVMGMSKPDELTDRHSLAVLVLWILLLRNVMLTQTCYDPDDQIHDDELGYGRYACFSENPDNRRNWIPRIGSPLFRNGALSIRSLTPKIQELTDRALIRGLHNPSKRPMAYEWENALAEAYDALICCPVCRQSFFYQYWLQPPQRRQCPFCGTGIRAPLPTIMDIMEERTKGTYISVRTIVLYHGLPVFIDTIESGRLPPFARRNTPKIGQVLWDQKEKIYRLINISDTPWQIISGGSGPVGRGDSIPLRKGLLLCFGSGKRLARVIE